MEAAGKGRVQFLSGSATTAIYLNFTDPGTEVDGERSHAKRVIRYSAIRACAARWAC